MSKYLWVIEKLFMVLFAVLAALTAPTGFEKVTFLSLVFILIATSRKIND